MARTIGILFSGFMVRLYGAALALYVASKAASYVVNAFGAVNAGLPL